MNKEEYLSLVKRVTPKEKKLANAVNAFIMGGTLGFIGEGLKLFLVNQFNLTVKVAINWVLFIFIFVGSFLTAIGIFDKLVGKFKSGLLIPITGFAHAITSAAMDYKTDGPITGLGANFFKLSGCVIIYGVLAAFIMALVKVMIYA